jgi:multicomponent Na+:H+ antiporter subunit D
MGSQIAILLVVGPMVVSFLIPLLGWLNRRLAFPLALIAIAGSFATALAIAIQVAIAGPFSYFLGGWDPPWGIEYRFDHLNAFMAVVVSLIALLAVIYSKQSITRERPDKEVHFYCIFLLLFTGLIGMVATHDMFNLYVFLEISSLTAYALIAIGDDKANFAAFRYVVIGTIGACFYLLGVGYLYIVTGSLNMGDLAERLPELYGSRVVVVAFIFFMVGMGIKMGLFPLHTWLPGAYTHAPSSVSAYIAPLMTKVAAYALIRVMFFVFQPEFSVDVLPLQQILSWIAAVAVVYGSVVAIAQSDLKRMLAFSSVSQIGYIVLGVTLGNHEGFVGSLLHILNHAFMKGCLFAVAGAIIYRLGTRKIEDLAFLHRKMPLTAAAFAVAAFSMIGLPPTAGFFSKWYLILGAVKAGNWIFVAVILASSLLNAAYFFRVIEHMYWKPMRELRARQGGAQPLARTEAPGGMLVPILALAIGILILGLASSWIIDNLLSRAVPAGML